MDAKLFNEIINSFDHLWHLKVANIGGNDLTISSIIVSLIIFIIGFKISRKISLFVRNVSSFKSLNENTRYTLESITFYSLLLIFTFTSLNIAQIPLQAFALLGGALAIGFGFGSQNIIKNFISGIILMIEQNIRVGDIIIIDNTEGRVHRIGARSTHITTFDNVDILVPNSFLLENNVVNWTLSDNEIRTSFTINVSYGSDTRKVEKILKTSIEQSAQILRNRPIDIYFASFGENAMNFKVQFWCKMYKPGDKQLAESEVRHIIYKNFIEAGITISFPQRDLHIDTKKPIEVTLTR